MVSIPVLHSWARLLRHPSIRDSAHVTQSIGPLLETCSHRLVRYEALPEDPKNATLHFLNEDIDTVPERHAFLGNYRRYCVDVVEVIVRKTPIEALHHILGQAENLFLTLYDGNTGFEGEDLPAAAMLVFNSVLMPFSSVEFHQELYTCAESRCSNHRDRCRPQGLPQVGLKPGRGAPAECENFVLCFPLETKQCEQERDHNGMQDFFENWCRNVMRIEFQVIAS